MAELRAAARHQGRRQQGGLCNTGARPACRRRWRPGDGSSPSAVMAALCVPPLWAACSTANRCGCFRTQSGFVCITTFQIVLTYQPGHCPHSSSKRAGLSSGGLMTHKYVSRSQGTSLHVPSCHNLRWCTCTAGFRASSMIRTSHICRQQQWQLGGHTQPSVGESTHTKPPAAGTWRPGGSGGWCRNGGAARQWAPA